MCRQRHNVISERKPLRRRGSKSNIHRRILGSRNGLAESHWSVKWLEADDSRLPPNRRVILKVARVGTSANGGLGLGPQKASRLRIQRISIDRAGVRARLILHPAEQQAVVRYGYGCRGHVSRRSACTGV